MRRRAVEVFVMAGALFSFGDMAEAQGDGPGPFVGISLIAADAVGEMGAFVNHGFGLQLEGGGPAALDGHLRFRGDLGFVIYGLERQHLCYSYSCRVGSQLTTVNGILYGGIGPELVLSTGALQPYVNASAGLSYFVTTSSLDDNDGYGSYMQTTNYSDLVMAWKFGGGVRMRVGRGHRPIFLDFGVERHRNGIANFLTVGDIVDYNDGSIGVFPNQSEADLMTFKFGVTIGFPSGRDRY
jgi:hypothetical protein